MHREELAKRKFIILQRSEETVYTFMYLGLYERNRKMQISALEYMNYTRIAYNRIVYYIDHYMHYVK